MNILYINNSLHLAPKYAKIFVRSQFSQATLSENCSLLEPGNLQRQISEHIFAQNGGYTVIIILQVIFPTRVVLKIGESDLRPFNKHSRKKPFAEVEVASATSHRR